MSIFPACSRPKISGWCGLVVCGAGDAGPIAILFAHDSLHSLTPSGFFPFHHYMDILYTL